MLVLDPCVAHLADGHEQAHAFLQLLLKIGTVCFLWSFLLPNGMHAHSQGQEVFCSVSHIVELILTLIWAQATSCRIPSSAMTPLTPAGCLQAVVRGQGDGNQGHRGDHRVAGRQPVSRGGGVRGQEGGAGEDGQPHHGQDLPERRRWRHAGRHARGCRGYAGGCRRTPSQQRRWPHHHGASLFSSSFLFFIAFVVILGSAGCTCIRAKEVAHIGR